MNLRLLRPEGKQSVADLLKRLVGAVNGIRASLAVSVIVRHDRQAVCQAPGAPACTDIPPAEGRLDDTEVESLEKVPIG